MSDASELIKLEEDLLRCIPRVEDGAWDEVKAGAFRVKQGWQANLRRRMSTPSHIPHLPPAVSYDVHLLTPSHSTAEIGYDRDKGGKAGEQAKVGHIIEFGRAGQAPGNDGGKALDAEEPRFIAALEKVCDIPL